jgi:plasmid maintenance system antidote protein VapI
MNLPGFDFHSLHGFNPKRYSVHINGPRCITFKFGVAVRLGRLFGHGAGIWTRMQSAYDTWHAERTEDVSHIPTIKAKAA